jgi:hypothetical protein
MLSWEILSNVSEALVDTCTEGKRIDHRRGRKSENDAAEC